MHHVDHAPWVYPLCILFILAVYMLGTFPAVYMILRYDWPFEKALLITDAMGGIASLAVMIVAIAHDDMGIFMLGGGGLAVVLYSLWDDWKKRRKKEPKKFLDWIVINLGHRLAIGRA